MPTFKTAEEYEAYHKKLEEQYENATTVEERERLWQEMRKHASTVYVPFLFVAEHLPCTIILAGEQIIDHITLNTRKKWDIEGREHVCFWRKDDNHKNEPFYHLSNTMWSLTHTLVPISRADAIRFGVTEELISKYTNIPQEDKRPAIRVGFIFTQY